MTKHQLFLDTANISEIRQLCRTDAIAGVTTNPSLMSKERPGNYVDNLLEIADAFEDLKHLSIEVLSSDLEKMGREAGDLFYKFRHRMDVYIKIPVSLGTLPIISVLNKSGVLVNATACMTAVQAKLAADAGASFVSFFYNRMKDWNRTKYKPKPWHNILIAGGARFNEDPYSAEAYATEASMSEIRIFKTLSDVPVICGSIRKPEDVLECWNAGADFVTASYKVIDQMMTHEKTTEAVAQFQKDIALWQS